MSGDFRKFPKLRPFVRRYPELQEYDVLASPNPGDCLAYREPSPPSADLWGFQHPIGMCCLPRLVSLSMAKGDSTHKDAAQDRSTFTREAFGVI